jgi:hypothetical protein
MPRGRTNCLNVLWIPSAVPVVKSAGTATRDFQRMALCRNNENTLEGAALRRIAFFENISAFDESVFSDNQRHLAVKAKRSWETN